MTILTGSLGSLQRRTDRLVPFALVTVSVLELLWQVSRYAPLGLAADVAVLAVLPLAAPRFGLREAYLLSLCLGLCWLAALLSADPVAVIRTGLSQAAFLMAFILLIGLIQQAASTSNAIRDCGLYLTRQPSGRRFVALFLGTHAMVHLFNLGVVSLLTPLIRSGSEAAAGDALQPLRERRQLSAMLRGFAWAVTWSPTAIAPLVVMTLLPEAERGWWIAVGLVIAFLAFLIGWADDRFQFRAIRRQLTAGAPRAAPVFPARAYAHFALACAALLALALSAMALLDGSVILGLMAASPVMLVGWLLVQNGGLTAGSLAATRSRVGTIFTDYLPRAAPLAVTLACSGFIGRTAAALIPAADWAEAIGIGLMPGWLFLLALSTAVAVLSQFALSPIMMAVFFGSLVADLPYLPADVTWAALAISCGWALSMTISPFATVVLMVEQMTGHTGRAMTWIWNGRFTALCLLMLAVVFWLLTGGR